MKYKQEWVVSEHDDGLIVIIPFPDMMPHVDKSLECSCNPELLEDNIISHNSFRTKKMAEDNINGTIK